MAAKIKLKDHIAEIKNGVWGCATSEQMAASLQEVHDQYFSQTTEYIVDIDQQGAELMKRLFQAQVLEVKAPEPNDPQAVVF